MRIIVMIRCDNCGWYNPEEATRCEKCSEPLDTAKHEYASEPAPEPVPAPSNPMAQTEPKILKATMKFDQKQLEALAGEEEASTCPKCGYPLSGSPAVCPSCGASIKGSTRKEGTQEFAKTVTMMQAAPEPHAAAQASPQDLGKRTIRDIPKELLQDAAPSPVQPIPARPQRQFYKLVPLHGTDHPEITMEEGDIVIINNLRFRFKK